MTAVKTNTRIDGLVPWSADFYSRSPLFAPVQSLGEEFSGFSDWPGLADYQHLLDTHGPVSTLNGTTLKIVPQAGRPERFDEHYAPRIYYHGELQTRTRNWHDFFQLLTWFIFPRSKAVINAIHIPRAKARIEAGIDIGRRSPIENMLSLFDEGGAVLVASDNSLLNLIRDFRWKELFWGRRADLAQNLDCITFGHAMYEKALAPYLGMTANTILIEADKTYFQLDHQQRLAWIDARLATIFDRGDLYSNPRDLQPFPILGMPGWDSANTDERYYDNTDYFRPGRSRNKSTVT